MQQEAPTRFEEAAKFLATIISLSITILFASLYRLALDEETKTKLALLLCALIGALLLAFMVMFPMRYKYSSKSVDQIKEATQKSVKFKQRFFIVSVGLYLLSLLSLISFNF
jgi:glucose-6-phosphate-specific signal transduction histidine kinase